MRTVKRYPNWYGVKGIRFIWQGAYSDSLIVYRGYVFNEGDIDSALWDYFCEDTGTKDSEAYTTKAEKDYTEWLKNNAKNYLDDCIFGKCYERRFY